MKLIMVNKNYSSWSLRAWLGAKMTGQEFEEIVLPLWTEDFYAHIDEYSPTGKVPVLIDDDVAVWESIAILDYLHHKFPHAGIWPKDLKAFAHAKSVAAEMHAGFMALRSAAPMNLRENRDHMDMDEKVTDDVARIEESWHRCIQNSGGPFLFGHFSGADAMYAPVVFRLHGYGVDVSDDTRAYMDRILKHPFIEEWVKAAAEESLVVDLDEIPADQTILTAS